MHAVASVLHWYKQAQGQLSIPAGSQKQYHMRITDCLERWGNKEL
jgi:hypothetical protein